MYSTEEKLFIKKEAQALLKDDIVTTVSHRGELNLLYPRKSKMESVYKLFTND